MARLLTLDRFLASEFIHRRNTGSKAHAESGRLECFFPGSRANQNRTANCACRHGGSAGSKTKIDSQDETLNEAVHAVLTTRLKPGDGGIDAVDRLGNITMQNNTTGLSRAAADSSGYQEVKLGNE